MEYEQMEYGRKVLMEAISRQDVNSYYDLLAPSALLVTHFPYPTTSHDSNLQAVLQWVRISQGQPAQQKDSPATTVGASRRRAMELLQSMDKHREEQRKRYEAFRKRREGHHSAGSGGEEADGGDGDGGETAVAAAAAAAAGSAGVAADAAAKATTAAAAAEGDAASRRDPSAKSSALHKASGRSGGGGGAAQSLSPSSSSSSHMPDGVRWFRQQQQQEKEKEKTAPASKTPPAPRDGAMAYEDAVDIAEGRMMVSLRFFELLHWISAGKQVTSIAPVELDVQLRKDILQEDEVLPPPAAPSSLRGAFEQLGTQHTERNQPLSCITVVWGGEYLLFRDKLYFDDGLVVTVQRTMLSVAEMVARAPPTPSGHLYHNHQQQQQRLSDRKERQGAAGSTALAAQADPVYKAVEAFYGVSASRVNTVNTAWALLDYSFVDASEPSLLLRLRPASGVVHVAKPPRVAADPRFAQGVFLNQNNDPTTAGAAGNASTLIKAKNKQGEEEAYEFNDNRHRMSLFQKDDGSGKGGSGDGDSYEDDEWMAQMGGRKKGEAAGGGGGGGGRVLRYDASCVRISGCGLQSRLDQLVPVLRRLVANSLLTLHTLDLSQNRIAALPDLRILPLQNLKLHDNAIADWRVVETQIAPLPYLTILTLHGNPIAEETEVPRSYAGTAATTTKGAGSGGGAALSKSRPGGGGAAAAGSAGTSGDSIYWRKLLAILLSHPARVAQLRQVDFVTLTRQDYNVAGAHALFTTGKPDVLNRARMMGNSGASRSAGSKTVVSAAATGTRAA